MLDLVDIGRIAIGLAFGVATFASLVAVASIWRRTPELAEAARNALGVVAAVATTAVVTMAAGLLSRDFSIAFVADHSNTDMPLGLTLAALWGGQEGSLLYWTWGLSVFAAVAGRRMLSVDRGLGAWGIVVLAIILTFFLGTLAFATPPFQRLAVAPTDGRGLNPLLWDSGMQVHPPMLLAGYMSFTVPFAIAMAALLGGAAPQRWLREMRNWMLLAWAIQGIGLLLGAWWAYRVLGWGGYWGWDPVENVALLPWLVATAYLHSALAQERRGQLRAWSMGLVLAGFALALFGTFVVRSGILTSVHSFAISEVGPIFLVFVGAVLIVATLAFLYRLPMLRAPEPITSVLSKEAGFLINNFVLVAIAVTTFWGTVFPIISEIVTGARVTVGPPFYAQVNVPLLLILLGLLGIWPLMAWRRTSWAAAWRATRWPILAAAAVSALLAILGMRHGLPLLAFALAAMVIAGVALEYRRSIRAGVRPAGEAASSGPRLRIVGSRRRLGGHLVHLGVALFAIGVIGSSAFKQETAVTLGHGETASFAGYEFTFQGLATSGSPNLTTVAAAIDVSRDGKSLARLTPTRRVHRGWESQPTSDVAVLTTVPSLEDIYVLLSTWDADGGTATLRMLINPLVVLLWAGGVTYVIGVIAVAWPSRVARRRAVVIPTPLGGPARP